MTQAKRVQESKQNIEYHISGVPNFVFQGGLLGGYVVKLLNLNLL